MHEPLDHAAEAGGRRLHQPASGRMHLCPDRARPGHTAQRDSRLSKTLVGVGEGEAHPRGLTSRQPQQELHLLPPSGLREKRGGKKPRNSLNSFDGRGKRPFFAGFNPRESVSTTVCNSSDGDHEYGYDHQNRDRSEEIADGGGGISPILILI